MNRTSIGIVLAALLTPALCEATWPQLFRPRPIAPEYQQLLSDWYPRYLGRPLDPQGLEGWGRRLMRGDTPREVEAAILGSNEYFVRNGGNDAAFVQALFRDVVGAPADPAQLNHWLRQLDREDDHRGDLAEKFLKTMRRGAPLPPAPPPPLNPPAFYPPVGTAPPVGFNPPAISIQVGTAPPTQPPPVIYGQPPVTTFPQTSAPPLAPPLNVPPVVGPGTVPSSTLPPPLPLPLPPR